MTQLHRLLMHWKVWLHSELSADSPVSYETLKGCLGLALTGVHILCCTLCMLCHVSKLPPCDAVVARKFLPANSMRCVHANCTLFCDNNAIGILKPAPVEALSTLHHCSLLQMFSA